VSVVDVEMPPVGDAEGLTLSLGEGEGEVPGTESL
jgi:hypothetical protein